MASSTVWVATLLYEERDEHYCNEDRLALLCRTARALAQKQPGDGVILTPAGWLEIDEEPRTIYNEVLSRVGPELRSTTGRVVVCVGIDGRSGADQIGLVLDATGIIGAARKFYPTASERDWVAAAPDMNSLEDGLPRTFSLNGNIFYVAVCYDTFGIHHQDHVNHGVHAILVHAHRFNRRGEGGSGDVDFARKGMAGAARQWDCLVFGAAAFFNRHVPPNWPSGIVWTNGDQSVKTWKYTDNPLQPQDIELTDPELEGVILRLFHLPPTGAAK